MTSAVVASPPLGDVHGAALACCAVELCSFVQAVAAGKAVRCYQHREQGRESLAAWLLRQARCCTCREPGNRLHVQLCASLQMLRPRCLRLCEGCVDFDVLVSASRGSNAEDGASGPANGEAHTAGARAGQGSVCHTKTRDLE